MRPKTVFFLLLAITILIWELDNPTSFLIELLWLRKLWPIQSARKDALLFGDDWRDYKRPHLLFTKNRPECWGGCFIPFIAAFGKSLLPNWEVRNEAAYQRSKRLDSRDTNNGDERKEKAGLAKVGQDVVGMWTDFLYAILSHSSHLSISVYAFSITTYFHGFYR